MTRGSRPLDAEKVKQHCDLLRDLIGGGPRENPEILRKALGIVRSLQTAAKWDYPQQILQDLKERISAWFRVRQWRGDEAELRRDLLQHVDQLLPSSEQPVGY